MDALVIDDSRTMRLILGRMLDEFGFTVSTAGDGSAALAEMTAGLNPELILVDWNMPVMTGIEFIQRVRAAPFDCDASIMMVTTETEIPRVEAALEAGADEYVMKPFTKDIIYDKLQTLGFNV